MDTIIPFKLLRCDISIPFQRARGIDPFVNPGMLSCPALSETAWIFQWAFMWQECWCSLFRWSKGSSYSSSGISARKGCLTIIKTRVARPERPEGAKDEVKRPKGPPAKSRGPEGLWTSSCDISPVKRGSKGCSHSSRNLSEKGSIWPRFPLFGQF